jgi:hypothetical protein
MNCETKMMNKMLENFTSQYPRTAKEVAETFRFENENTVSYFVISLSLLMCKITKGCYKSYHETTDKIPAEVIDIFGVSYTKQFIYILNELITIGEEAKITEVKSLEPDRFFEKMINQFAN